MIGLKTSKKFQEMEKKLNELPKLVDDVFSSVSKEDCLTFMEEFQNHLRNNDLGITALKQETIDSKTRKGYEKPETPLYGLGEEEEDSYINVFELEKLKDGYRAKPRDDIHHDADISLARLLSVHEHGRTIKRGDVLIVIPPRPIAMLTYRSLFSSKKLRKSVPIITKGFIEVISEGSKKILSMFISKVRSLGKDKE